MNVWKLLLIFEMALCAVVGAFVFVAWRRRARRVAKAHSPEHRLKIPNLWTETQQDKHGGRAQMMRMKDGQLIRLYVGLDTAKVSVGTQPEAVESFAELVSFPVGHSHRSRHRAQAAILESLRRQIGFPGSVDELRQKSRALSSPEDISRT